MRRSEDERSQLSRGFASTPHRDREVVHSVCDPSVTLKDSRTFTLLLQCVYH